MAKEIDFFIPVQVYFRFELATFLCGIGRKSFVKNLSFLGAHGHFKDTETDAMLFQVQRLALFKMQLLAD